MGQGRTTSHLEPLHPSVPCPYRLAAVEVDSTWLVYAPVSPSPMVFFRRPACCQWPRYQFWAWGSMCPWRPTLKKLVCSNGSDGEVHVECHNEKRLCITLSTSFNSAKNETKSSSLIRLHCRAATNDFHYRLSAGYFSQWVVWDYTISQSPKWRI